MFEGGRSKMGLGEQDPASRRRRSRSIPAEPSIGFAPRLKLTRSDLVRRHVETLGQAGAPPSGRMNPFEAFACRLRYQGGFRAASRFDIGIE
jgi:hypothetical protein